MFNNATLISTENLFKFNMFYQRSDAIINFDIWQNFFIKEIFTIFDVDNSNLI